MASISTINCCCLNQNSSPPPPPPHSSKPTNLFSSWQRKELISPWRRQCVVGMMACMIVNGSELGSIFGDVGGGANTTTSGGGGDVVFVDSDKKKVMMMRWSDKRACPPWRMNSFETIVPENLPRPSFHRKSESVSSSTLSSRTRTSEQIVNKVMVHSNSNSNSNPNCFSL